LKRLNGLLLWPAYFDAGKKRSEGRKLPIKLSLESPTTAELVEVCKQLSLKAEVKEGKHYPRSWWDDANPILVETAGTKSKLLAHVAVKLREQRQNNARKAGELERRPKRK